MPDECMRNFDVLMTRISNFVFEVSGSCLSKETLREKKAAEEALVDLYRVLGRSISTKPKPPKTQASETEEFVRSTSPGEGEEDQRCTGDNPWS